MDKDSSGPPPPPGTGILECPKCGRILDPGRHGDLIFDGQVWCDRCHEYDRELIRPRDFPEIKAWSQLICEAFGRDPVSLREDSNPALFRKEASVVLAEAEQRERSIVFYPPGLRLTTLCHELAHIFTSQDHDEAWAGTFARLVAWVKSRLAEDRGPEGFQARLSIYAGIPRRVYSPS